MTDSSPPFRVTLLCCAATAATRAGRFPQADDALDEDALARLRRVSFSGGRRRCCTSPARPARETAAALGLDAAPEPPLADADPGHWAGRALADLALNEPDALARWLTDPDAAPPDGEAFTAVTARFKGWLDRQTAGPEVVAVTHPSLIRAAVVVALDAPPAASLRIDVPPLTLTRLSGRPGRWRLVCVNGPLESGGR